MEFFEAVKFNDTPGLEGVTFYPADETARLTLLAAAESGALSRCVRAFREGTGHTRIPDFEVVQTSEGPVLYKTETGAS